MYSKETTFVRRTDTLNSRIGDDMILMDSVQGEFLTLNAVASRAFELLESRMDFEKLCDLLIDEFEVDPDLCRKERLNSH